MTTKQPAYQYDKGLFSRFIKGLFPIFKRANCPKPKVTKNDSFFAYLSGMAKENGLRFVPSDFKDGDIILREDGNMQLNGAAAQFAYLLCKLHDARHSKVK